jgi:hypothetical protein
MSSLACKYGIDINVSIRHFFIAICGTSGRLGSPHPSPHHLLCGGLGTVPCDMYELLLRRNRPPCAGH